MGTKKYNNDFGDLEWSPVQRCFHFREPMDRKSEGWDVVVEMISPDISSMFIQFLNHNWRQRQGLPASEIRKMFDAWMLMQEGGSNG